MRKRMTAGKVAILAVAVGLCSCRKEPGPQVAKDVPPPSGDTNFTPPEIRRPAPSVDTATAKAVHDAAGTAPADSAKRFPVPVKTEPAKIEPAKIAAVAPVSKPTPAPAPVAAAKPPAPKVAAKGPAAPGDPGPQGDWVLQVNVYPSQAAANAEVDHLASQGIPAYAIPVPTEGAKLAGQYWRVRVGRFKSRADAQGYGDRKIVPAGLKFWIDKKSNELNSPGAL